MKILAIRGANLASLAREFEVDLAHGALGASGLFAIVGNTGAGKSTLLDALCVALFDRTPRSGERQRNAVLIGRGSDETSKVSSHDVRALLRRGAGRGFAEVDFQGDDGRRYRARWEVHRARDKAEGALQNQEMSLLAIDDSDGCTERLGGTKTETLAAIEERLGLSFDQFRRSALLAQGDFAAFLRADGKDRSELLERMTGTEIYSQLSIAAHRRGQAAEQRVKDLGIAMAAVEVLSEAALAELNADLEDANAQHHTSKQRLAWTERAAQWSQLRVRLSAEVSEAERELAHIDQQAQLAVGLRAEHELQQRAETLRPLWQAAQRATSIATDREQQLNATSAHVATAAAAASAAHLAVRRVEELLIPVRELREGIRLPAPPPHPLTSVPTVDQMAVRVGEPVTWLNAQRHRHTLAAAWPEIVTMEERSVQLRHSVATLERSAQRLRADIERLGSRRALLEQERQSAQQAIDEATRRAAPANVPSAKSTWSLETAAKHEDAARNAVAQAERLSHVLAAARAATATVAESSARQTQCRDDMASAEADLRSCDDSLRSDGAASSEAEAALARLLAAASMSHARAALVDGDPCPLCGALEHPWHGRGEFDELIVAQQAAVADLRARIAVSQSTAMQRQLELTSLRMTAAILRTQHDDAAEQVRITAETWRDRLRDLGELALVVQPDSAAAEALTRDHATRARRSLEKARAERSKLQAMSNAAAEAAALLLTKQHDLEQVGYRLADVERERLEFEDKAAGYDRDIASQRAAGRELMNALAARLASWDISAEEMQSEPARVLEDLRVTVETWRRHVDKLYEYEAALTQHFERSNAAAAAADTELTSARANLATYHHQHQTALADLAESARHLHDGCVAVAISADTLRQLMTAPASRVHDLAKQLAEVARQADLARSMLDERRRTLAEHDQNRPTALPASLSSLVSEPALDAAAANRDLESLDTLRHRTSECEDRVLALRARLERDHADRKRRDRMSAEVMAAQDAGEVDRALAQAIGSHDGKLLRAFAQSLTLDTLLELANSHLDDLAPRYQLERVPRHDLELQVIDRDMGDEVRAVQSLSGGEGFLVSLALALALSSLAAGSVRVRTLLIDEGFGTLDPATLDGALAVLDALQSTGRQVGIISHIPGLIERVSAHVKVIQRGSGRSEVVVAS